MSANVYFNVSVPGNFKVPLSLGWRVGEERYGKSSKAEPQRMTE